MLNQAKDAAEEVIEQAKNAVDTHYSNKDCAAYRDFREVIARDDIDALSLAVPDHWHSIPAIMGARGATRLIPDGATVLLDGSEGRVWISPQSLQQTTVDGDRTAGDITGAG